MSANEKQTKGAGLETAYATDVFEVAKAKIDMATRDKKSGLGKQLLQKVEQEKPIEEIQRLYMEKQFADLGMGVSNGEGEAKSVDKINLQVMQQVQLRRDGQYTASRMNQTPGNIGNRIASPGRSASMNAANISARSRQESEAAKGDTAEKEQRPDRAEYQKANGAAQRLDEMKESQRLKERMKAKLASMNKNHDGIGAFDAVLLFFIFIISVVSDVVDLAIDITGVGAFLAPVKSLLVGISLTILWWFVGGEFRAANLKKLVGGTALDGIPVINLLPIQTLTFFVNVVFMMGILDNKIGDEVRKFVS